MALWMHVCKCASVHGCMDAWMHGCMGAWVHGCMGAWMHGCMGASRAGRLQLSGTHTAMTEVLSAGATPRHGVSIVRIVQPTQRHAPCVGRVDGVELIACVLTCSMGSM